MSEKLEYVEVTVKVPKAVYEFYKAFTGFLREDMESFLQKMIVNEIPLIIDDFQARGGDELIERYGLDP